MKHFLFVFLLLPVWADSLHYNINWPSGLSLGEATLTSDRAGEKSGGNWNISLNIDASIPGFAVRDQYNSVATADLCGVGFDKSYTHGKHTAKEHIRFDQREHTATRETVGGGK